MNRVDQALVSLVATGVLMFALAVWQSHRAARRRHQRPRTTPPPPPPPRRIREGALTGSSAGWRDVLDHGATVHIACCPIHGLHGARQTCFECGGPVDQLELVSAHLHAEVGKQLDRVIVGLSDENQNLRARLLQIIEHPALAAQLARDALNDDLAPLKPTAPPVRDDRDLGTL